MSIGVLRIYLGMSWAESGEESRLLAGLDSVPQFLYRIDQVDPRQPRTAADPGSIRIAMTQSHVALLLLTGSVLEQGMLAVELNLARRGFRRGIPVVGVLAGEGSSAEAFAALCLDRIVGPGSDAVICALQEVAEEAAAHFRQEASKLAAGVAPLPATASSGVAEAAKTDKRTLPYGEIAFARDQLRARRQQAQKAR